MKPMLTGLRVAGLMVLVAALSACAGVFLVDNDVQSFARWKTEGIPSGAQSYRFERLPSQQHGDGAQNQVELERLGGAALARRGWTVAQDPTLARWTVQLSAVSVRLPRAPWEDPWLSPWGGWVPGWGLPGRDYLVTGSGQVVLLPTFPRFEQPYYQRSVALLIRDAASGQVVYETRAAHDGRWQSSSALWSAMIDAALQDFPLPPSGVRRVNIEVPR